MGTEKGVNSEADDCWKGIFRFPVVRNAAVVSGIFLLNLPAVVSRWQPEANSNALYSILSHLKRFPVFSLSTKFLDSHISLSVDNINEGRYYTAVTTLFNHSGPEHFIGNMRVLFYVGSSVLYNFGIGHFLVIYFGGGITGSLLLLDQYSRQKLLWHNSTPGLKNFWFGGETLESIRVSAMDKVFNITNASTPVVGASSAVAATVVFDACSSLERIYRIFLRRRKVKLSVNRNIQENANVTTDEFSDAFQILMDSLSLFFVGSLILNDLSSYMKDLDPERGFLSGLVAYSTDGTGHAGHLGGFVFGLCYFLVMKGVCRLLK